MNMKPWPKILWLFFTLVAVTLFWWLFAFWPQPEKSPEWMLRASAVCFGRSVNGLPEVQGWIMLVGAPLGLFATFFALWWREFLGELRGFWRHGVTALASGVLFLSVVWTAWLVGVSVTEAPELVVFSESPLDFPETYPQRHVMVPDFTLMDHAGKEISLKQFSGRLIYLTFAFAHCKTICPMILDSIKKVAKKNQVPDAVFLVITLDPWRDTPATLKSFASEHDFPSNTHLLSGPVNEVNRVLDMLEIPRTRDENTGDIAHPGLMHVIGPDGKIIYTLNNASPKVIAQAGLRAMQSSVAVQK